MGITFILIPSQNTSDFIKGFSVVLALLCGTFIQIPFLYPSMKVCGIDFSKILGQSNTQITQVIDLSSNNIKIIEIDELSIKY